MNNSENRIREFNDWVSSHRFGSAYIARYCGPEHLSTLELSLSEIQKELRFWLDNGFKVEWSYLDKTLYLCVIESWDEPLNWEKIMLGEHFVDVDQILREAGFQDDMLTRPSSQRRQSGATDG